MKVAVHELGFYLVTHPKIIFLNFEEGMQKLPNGFKVFSISLFIITESLTPRKLLRDKSAYLNSLMESYLSLYFPRKVDFMELEKKKVSLLWASISTRCLDGALSHSHSQNLLSTTWGWLKATLAGPYWRDWIWFWENDKRKVTFLFNLHMISHFHLPIGPHIETKRKTKRPN